MRNDGLKLERHHIANEVKPVTSYVYKGIKIGIGDSGFDHIIVPLTELQTDLMNQFPDGFYETVFTVFHDEKPLLEQPLWFDKNHDIEQGRTEEAREKSRINATKSTAEALVDDLIKNEVFQELAA